MKFKREVTYRMIAEIKEVKAPKGKSWWIPIWQAERELSKKYIWSQPQFFNNQGSICIAVKTRWKVYLDGKLHHTYLTEKSAIKEAKLQLSMI